jgi:hypothetical protein
VYLLVGGPSHVLSNLTALQCWSTSEQIWFGKRQFELVVTKKRFSGNIAKAQNNVTSYALIDIALVSWNKSYQFEALVKL